MQGLNTTRSVCFENLKRLTKKEFPEKPKLPLEIKMTNTTSSPNKMPHKTRIPPSQPVSSQVEEQLDCSNWTPQSPRERLFKKREFS
jgi:hypothetical protein